MPPALAGLRLSILRLDTVDRDSFLRPHRWFFIEVLAVGMNGRPFRDFRRNLGFGILRYPANSNLIAAIGYLRNNQSRIALSTDAGKAWIFRTLNVGNPYSIAFDPMDTTTIYVGARGSYAMTKSTDFGRIWSFINKGLNGVGLVSVIAIDCKNTKRVFIGTNANMIFGSDDAGAHWKEQSQGIPPPTEDKFFINSIRFDPSHSNVLYTANSSVFSRVLMAARVGQKRIVGFPVKGM